MVAYFASVYFGATDADFARATGVCRQAITEARARALAAYGAGLPSWRPFFEIHDDGASDGATA